MKIRKKIGLLWMLCLILAVPVYAETSDGIEASIQTKKDTYSNTDTLDLDLKIKNNNDYAVEITDINSTELDSYATTTKLLNNPKKLESGEEMKVGLSYQPTTVIKPTPEPDTITPEPESITPESASNTTDTKKKATQTNTGDSSHVFLWIVLCLFSAAGLYFVAKKKKGKALLSIILVMAMSIPSVILVKAEETKIEKKLKVAKDISVGTTTKTIQADITYLLNSADLSTDNTVSFDLNYETENRVSKKTIATGEYVSYDEELMREGYLNIGWYTDPTCSEESYFDMRQQPITEDIILYAGWFDIAENTDTDADGIPDSLEEFLHFDPANADTDNDGLSDYDELFKFDTNPLKKDTDDNGVEDGQEDNDNDQLNNLQELSYCTSPNNTDTDNDGITDYDEVMTYHTDPLKKDTDEDNASDIWEIENGYDPLVFNDTFNIIYTEEHPTSEHPVSVSLNFALTEGNADSFSVEEITEEENAYVDPSIAGYLGNAYDFSIDGTFDSAEMTFAYDLSLGTLSDEFQPRIYYFNEETKMMEELPDQTVEEGKVTATVTHFSMYILLNKVAFDKIWNAEIKPPTEAEDSTLDITFVIDYSYSMVYNDIDSVRLQVTKQFIDKLRDTGDRAAIIKFVRQPTVVCEMTNDKQILKDAVDSIINDNGFSSVSGTNGSAAIRSALDIMASSTADNKFIIFLTDGEDTITSYSYDDLVAEAKNNNIIIYSIGMASADEGLLSKIADGTGGKYYQATPALDLSDIYSDIESETIDFVTDTNNDGICDYYTKLIQEGILIPGNGSARFTGIDLNCDKNGNPSDDYDGDGLKNGEELSVIIHEDYVTLEMNSNPLTADSDGDGLLDGNSQYATNGDRIAPRDPEPMKYNGEKGMWKYHISYSQSGDVIAKEYDRSWNFWDSLFRDNIYKIVSQAENIPQGTADLIVQHLLLLHNKAEATAADWGKAAILIKDVSINLLSNINCNIGGKFWSYSQIESYLGSCLLNFIPDTMEQAYHSQNQTWQRKFGYNVFYDLIFEYGSNITEPLMIPVKVGNNVYALWMWKGDYWNLQNGAEIGLYIYSQNYAGMPSGDKNIAHYHAVDFEVPMSLSLYYYGNSISNLFSWSPSEPQWWCTGFTGFLHDANYPNAEKLISVGKVDLLGHEDIYDGLKTVTSNYSSNFIFDEDGHTIWTLWR